MTIVKLKPEGVKANTFSVKDIAAGCYFTQAINHCNTVYLKTRDDTGVVVYCADGSSLGRAYPSSSFGAGWKIIGKVTLTLTY
tara:strand:- start:19000 stop:19248 length:249 start_codon:yes stop_codon:yes gene_type:complete